jgi:Tol biopolymer transport system component
VADASWSPDGGIIEFTRSTSSNPSACAVELIAPDGTNDHRLVEGAFVRWSIDGNSIAYSVTSRTDLSVRIFSVGTDGAGTHEIASLTGRPYSFALAPDLRHVAWISAASEAQPGKAASYQILQASDGSSPLEMLHGSDQLAIDPFSLAYSPDGSMLAFIDRGASADGVNYTRDSAVWVMKSDGSGQKKITERLPGPLEGGGVTWWDGDTVLFRVKDDGPYLLEADGSGSRPAPFPKMPACASE